jgi:hypothetical protein
MVSNIRSVALRLRPSWSASALVTHHRKGGIAKCARLRGARVGGFRARIYRRFGNRARIVAPGRRVNDKYEIYGSKCSLAIFFCAVFVCCCAPCSSPSPFFSFSPSEQQQLPRTGTTARHTHNHPWSATSLGFPGASPSTATPSLARASHASRASYADPTHPTAPSSIPTPPRPAPHRSARVRMASMLCPSSFILLVSITLTQAHLILLPTPIPHAPQATPPQSRPHKHHQGQQAKGSTRTATTTTDQDAASSRLLALPRCPLGPGPQSSRRPRYGSNTTSLSLPLRVPFLSRSSHPLRTHALHS